MITRGSYVHKHMVKFSGAPSPGKCKDFCKFVKMLMVSDKTINKAFRIHKTLLEKFFIFTFYPNYTMALMLIVWFVRLWHATSRTTSRTHPNRSARRSSGSRAARSSTNSTWPRNRARATGWMIRATRLWADRNCEPNL